MNEFELFPDLQNTITQMQTIETSIGNMVSGAEKLLEKFNNLPKSTTQTNINPKLYTEAAAQAQALAKAYNDLIKVQATYTAQQEQTTQAQIAQTQATKEAISNKRLEIQATNEGIGSYQRAKAAIELEQRALLNLGQTEGITSQKFKDAQATFQTNATALRNLEQATGGVSRGMNAAYGPMFSFTQILREMPNFAISTRIGFMSLSNNIPMFVDEFKRFSQSINETTGKANGAKGAFNLMAKSLFGFNGFIILATTLLTILGPKLIEIAKGFFTGSTAVDNMTNSQKGLVDQMDKMGNTTHDVTGKVQLLGVELKKWQNNENGIQKDIKNSDAIVKTYNETMGQYYGKVKNVSEALVEYNKHALEFIEYTIHMNAAMDLANKAGDQFLRVKKQESILSMFPKKDVDKIKEQATEIYSLYERYYILQAEKEKGAALTSEESSETIIKAHNAWVEDLKGGDFGKSSNNIFSALINILGDVNKQVEKVEIANKIDKINKSISGIKNSDKIQNALGNWVTATSAMSSYKKAAYDVLPPLKAQEETIKRISGHIRSLQDYNIQPEELNQLKGALEADKAYQKSILDDETQSLKKRLEAEQQYYFDSIALIKTETIKEEQQATDKFNKQEAQIDKIHRNNLLKISQNNAAIIDIQKKADADLSKLAQDYEKYKSSAKGTDDLTRLKNKYQEKANAINKYVQDSIANQGKLSKETQNYNNAEYINRKTLVDKLFYLTEKEISDSHKVAIARKEDLTKMYLDEVNYLVEKNQLDAKNAKSENERNDLARQYNTLMEQRKNIGKAEFLGTDVTAERNSYQSLMETLNQYDLKQKQLSIDLDSANKNLAANKSTLADLSGLYTQVTFENTGTEAEKLTNDVNKLTDAYMKGDLTYAQYDEATKKIASTYNDSTQKQAKSATNLYLTIKQTNKNITKAVQDSDNATAALDKAVWDERIALAEKGNAMLSKLASDKKEELISIWSSYNSLMSTLGQNEINKLSEDKEKKDELYDAEVEEIQLKNEAGVLSDTEAAEQEATLKAEKVSYDKAIEREQNAIKKENFERDKKFKEANIIMETAAALATISIKQQEYTAILAAQQVAFLGFAAVTTPAQAAALYLPLKVMTIASSAMQLAAVAASQYSAYAQGTLGTKRDEMAWVGDGGKNELIVDPSGKMAVSPNKPTLTYLKRGTKVFPDISNLNDIETEAILRNIGIFVPENKSYDFSILANKLDRVVEAVSNNTPVVRISTSLFDKLDKRSSL